MMCDRELMRDGAGWSDIGDTMNIAARTDSRCAALDVADSHDVSRVHGGAREQPQGHQG
jgi:hypothetical protein